MSQNEFGNDYIVVTDEEGNELELEFIMSFDYEDKSYMAFLPADMDEDDPDFGYVILKVVEEDGEEIFVTVDDEDELQGAFDTLVILVESEED